MALDASGASQLYVWGYPLVYCTDEILKLTRGESGIFPEGIPFNTFGRARALLGPDAEFVSPNNDTLYLIAPLEVSGGPILLHTPDTGGRYYVLQFVDPWSNNFAYVGQRATGTKAADWLLTPPGYTGAVPAGATVIELPNDVAVIVGRIQVDGSADLPAVHALQDRFELSPLADGRHAGGIPDPDDRVPDDLGFWERLRVYLKSFPPPDADSDLLDLAAEVGLIGDESPLVTADSRLASALRGGAAEGAELIESLVAGAKVPPGEWSSGLHMFDYNVDRCGLGTLDSPEWKITDREKARVTRAVSARGGLWGNHGYEAFYALVHQDENGDALDGANRYQVTFDPPPPARAFWSLTMYDTPRYYLVDNPIDRYSIGDRTPGVRAGEGGSVTIYMQVESPGEDRASNWLPTPAGGFRPILRVYGPGDAILDGSYQLPRIERLD